LAALKPGDKVVCAGGIHATVVGVTDATVQVRIADQVRVDIEKASITAVKRPE
jgi:preprotein translocase YajC subunit